MKKKIKKTNKKEIQEMAKEVIQKDLIVKNLSKKTKMYIVGSLALVTLLVVIICCYFRFGVAATVNGKRISRLAYVTKLQKLDKKTVLDQMIQEALIKAEAVKKNIKIDQKEIDVDMAKIEEQIKQQGSTLEEALKSENMTKEEVIEQIRNQKIVEKLASPAAEITQEQIDKFLEDNKAYLPKNKTKEEIRELAKQQLENQGKSAAVSAFIEGLMQGAKIIYR